MQTPADLGFLMPAEWERHEATWMAWPHNSTDWPGKLDAIRWAYAEMIRRIAPGEIVRLLVTPGRPGPTRHLRLAGVDPGRVELIRHPTNRSWTRDSGPTFVRRRAGKRSETAIVHFHFNAWARYSDWRLDTRVPEIAARRLRKPLFDARSGRRKFVLEGGGIDVNGRGTLITTEECYLDRAAQVRNPGLDRAAFEAALRRYLGVTNILWLGRGITGDDTHGHVDDLCRFVNPTTMVMIRESNPADVNYRPLEENWERAQGFRLENGARAEIVALPMPAPLFYGRGRLPASYANFYIANAAVLVPTFNDPNDRVALGILSDLFRDRPVVGIHAVDLVLGFGAIHCLTQQQPK